MLKYLAPLLVFALSASAQVARFVPPSLAALGSFPIKGGSAGATLTATASVEKGTGANYLGSLDYGSKSGGVGVPIADQILGLTGVKATVSITASDVIGTYRLQKISFISDSALTYYNRDGTISRFFYDGTGLPTTHSFDLSALDFAIVAPGTPIPTNLNPPVVTPPVVVPPVVTPPAVVAATISTQPANIRTTAGQPASFTVGYTSASTASVQWRKNGSPIAGATGSQLVIASVSPADAGSYDAIVTNSGGTAATSSATLTVDAGRVKNISVRIVVPDGGLLTAGFVLDTPKTVLIRGIGRSLEQFGVAAGTTMANPAVTVFNSAGVTVAQNDDFATSAALIAATARVGAFGLASAQDAAVLVTLPAGAYTVQLRSVGGRGGDSLAEVYDVD